MLRKSEPTNQATQKARSRGDRTACLAPDTTTGTPLGGRSDSVPQPARDCTVRGLQKRWTTQAGKRFKWTTLRRLFQTPSTQGQHPFTTIRKGGVGSKPRGPGTSCGALTLEVGKLPTEVTRGRHVPGSLPAAICEFTSSSTNICSYHTCTCTCAYRGDKQRTSR